MVKHKLEVRGSIYHFVVSGMVEITESRSMLYKHTIWYCTSCEAGG